MRFVQLQQKKYQDFYSMLKYLEFEKELALPESAWLDQVDQNHIYIHLLQV